MPVPPLVIRRQETPGLARCAWCRGGRNRNDKLFRYGVWNDGGRQHWQGELFCSAGCRRSYHNID